MLIINLMTLMIVCSLFCINELTFVTCRIINNLSDSTFSHNTEHLKETFNIVLFLTEGLNDNGLFTENSVPRFAFVKGKLKKCASFVQSKEASSNSEYCNCKYLLQTSLVSLVHWAKTHKHMATGMISTTNSSQLNYDEFIYNVNDKENVDQMKNNNCFLTHNLYLASIPKKSNSLNIYDDDYSIENSEDEAVKDIYRYGQIHTSPFIKKIYKSNVFRKKRASEEISNTEVDRKYITSSDHKRNLNLIYRRNRFFPTIFSTDPNIKLTNFSTQVSDPVTRMFRLMSFIRKCVFPPHFLEQGKIFKKNLMANESDLKEQLFHKDDFTMTLLNTINHTLEDFKYKCDSDKNGFLLIVFDNGNISQVHDAESSLSKSIQCVYDFTTKLKNTLIVVIPMVTCDKNDYDNEELIPFYVVGTKVEELLNAETVYDIPFVLRQTFLNQNRLGKTWNNIPIYDDIQPRPSKFYPTQLPSHETNFEDVNDNAIAAQLNCETTNEPHFSDDNIFLYVGKQYIIHKANIYRLYILIIILAICLYLSKRQKKLN